MGACVGRRSVRSFDEAPRDECKKPVTSDEISVTSGPLESGGHSDLNSDAVTEIRYASVKVCN